jgi:hypothetical protein
MAGGRSTSQVLTLAGATFAPLAGASAWNAVYVSVFEDFVRLNFSDPPIWELLDAPTSVYINGYAEGTLTGSVSELRVYGEFEFCRTTANGECEEEVECESMQHKLTLTRQ